MTYSSSIQRSHHRTSQKNVRVWRSTPRSTLSQAGSNLRRLFVLLSLFALTSLSGCYPERVESVQLMNDGIKLYNQGKREAAVLSLDRSAKRDPTNHRAMFYRGQMLNELGTLSGDEDRFRDAARSFEESTKVNSSDPEVFFQLGIAYKNLKEYRDALRAFEQASDVQPHGQAHYHSGEIYLELEEYNKAQESLRSAIIAQPDLGVAYTALAKLYRRFKCRSEALIVLKNAIENDPGEAGHFRDIGEVYSDLKQHAKAVEYFEQALQIKPDDAPVVFLLGNAYLAIDDDESAEVTLRKYLRMGHRAEERLMIQKTRALIKRLQKKKR